MKKPAPEPVVARNRKAAHDYELGESWEAGIVLVGPEVKALRAGRASLAGGFVDVEDGEVWLHGVHIPQYTQARWLEEGSRRKRKLLLHRAQIAPVRQQVRGEAVTERVRAHLAVEADRPRVALDDLVEALPGERPAA